jgi:cytochrome c oxidase subunit 2
MTKLLDTIQSAAGKDAEQGLLQWNLFTTFLVVALIVYAIVLAFLLWALLRRRGGESRERSLRGGLMAWVGASALILAALTLGTWFTDRDLARAAAAPALEIEITANQWWWDVRYLDPDPSKVIRTANELHLPAGVAARVVLRSSDVIHSFWIPNLAGKQDMIPGRENALELRPTHPGPYRAQCAEFCGIQHARMALDVTVESPAAFSAWRAAQLAPPPPPPPDAALARAGQSFVTTLQCASCHAIAGTPASGQVGPDLSHVASRRSIAAGTLPMNHANLAAWIADPQRFKPGTNMPAVPLDAEQLEAVTAYLETLR